jgi:exodeoxyribonuclease-5
MKWSPQQAAALNAVAEWRALRKTPYFYLAGYAGTGKTTLAKHFAEGMHGNVAFGSFTGKAASVMRDKGCVGATTIHRLIYESRSKSGKRLRELQAQLAATATTTTLQRATLRVQIQQEIDKLKQPHFQLNPDANLRDAALVIIDECSMVNEEMGRDLLSFGVPVLVLGDPAQLPPVFGGGFFTKGEPDVMLTEVHRQARESGILRLATDVRMGKGLDYCDEGEAVVMPKGDLDPYEIPALYDQILVGRNKTRHATNKRMRDLMGYKSEFPLLGDRLVCLRNNHDLGLLNGEIYTAGDDARVFDDGTLAMQIDDGEQQQIVEAWQAHFLGEKPEHFDRSGDTQEFDFGYVLTVHKAQGSQWPSVLVFDESRCFRADWQKWLYTAITRAADHLTVIK